MLNVILNFYTILLYLHVMESIVDQVIKDKLASFSARDKAALFPYLLLLGIAHYELVHEHSSIIDMHGLQYLCSECNIILDDYTASHQAFIVILVSDFISVSDIIVSSCMIYYFR